MSTPPLLTPAAHAFLDGRAVHVRSRRRHGCCGGAAAMPTAEPGTPATLDGLERFDVSDTAIYVEPDLNPNDNPWTIDVDGFARWRRLVVLGLDLTAVADAPATHLDHDHDHGPSRRSAVHATTPTSAPARNGAAEPTLPPPHVPEP